jgi:hypothetical protein
MNDDSRDLVSADEKTRKRVAHEMEKHLQIEAEKRTSLNIIL